jgi:O-antigen/teichoic acid export membrane protein
VPLAGSQVLIAAGGHVDTAILAAALGSAALGAYSLAFTLVMAATARLASVVKTVAFAALSRSAEEGLFVTRALALLRRIAVVCTPVVVGIAAVGHDAVPLLLGAQWTTVPALLVALAPAGVIGGLGAGMGAIVLARGRPRVELGFAVMRIAGMSGAVALGVHLGGVRGAALGVSGYHLAAFPLFFFVLARWGGLAPGAVARAIAPGLVASAAMGAVVLGVRAAAGELAPWLRVALGIGAGLVAYPLLLRVLYPAAARDAWDTGVAVFRRARGAAAEAQGADPGAPLPTRPAIG